jgi:hypothetical protein
MDRPGDPAALLDDDATNGGLGLAVWGFTTVVAVILGFASWQYAPPHPEGAEESRVVALPASDEITGSIAVAERGAGGVAPARVVGGSRITPMALSPGESPATSRDIDQLRAEMRDLQRRMAQMGLSGDGLSRRLDRLEQRLTTLASASAPAPAATAAPPSEPAHEAAAPTAAPAATPVAAREAAPRVVAAGEAAADARRLPQPRPESDLPIVTGSLPPKPAAPGKADRQATAPAVPSIETVTVKPLASAAQPPAPVPAPTPAPHPAPHADASPVAAPTGTIAAIDLGGYRSLVSLKKSWSDLTERYTEFGNGIEALARLRETDTGMEARLVAGPYPSQNDAAKACIRLRALGVTCAVTGFTGQPLAAIR